MHLRRQSGFTTFFAPCRAFFGSPSPAPRLIPVVALALVGLTMASAGGAELVVVNPACQETSLPQHVLKALYSGRKRSLPDGERVEILVIDAPVHDRFVIDLLDGSPAQFASDWKRLVFLGQGKQPRSFASEAELLTYVAATPGCIGYIDAGTDHPGVKVLTVTP
jgi:ABC-type phosphate transport system substrate-binding protein